MKVEATKFTEVGYVGRDVDSIIRDLVEASIRMVKEEHTERVREAARRNAEDRLIDLIVHPVKKKTNPIDVLLATHSARAPKRPRRRKKLSASRGEVRAALEAGEMEERLVEIEVEETMPRAELPGTDLNMNDMLGSILPKKTKLRKVPVKEARKILCAEEEQALIDMDAVYTEAIERAEQDGMFSWMKSTRLPAKGMPTARTFPARACSAISCPSWKALP